MASSKQKDIECALQMMSAARRRLRKHADCMRLASSLPATHSKQRDGLIAKAQQMHSHARLLLQAARYVHPATTPKATGNARPATAPVAVKHVISALPARTVYPYPCRWPGLTDKIAETGRVNLAEIARKYPEFFSGNTDSIRG